MIHLSTNTLKCVLFTFLLLSFFQFAQAQIEVEPTGTLFTPESLISNVFLGDGVEVLDVQHTGTDNSVGYFTNGSNEIGIDRGIVMSTGRAVVASSPNSQGGTTGMTSGPSTDPYLNVIADNLNDLTSYTIRFVPSADTLHFRYTFASEEYPEYVCSEFNDAFGFFIHGPGINGPYPNNARNIALVPDPAVAGGLSFTQTPVTINNVNSGVPGGTNPASNCTPPNGSLAYGNYYRDNSNSMNLTYDGYLSVFFAQVVVTPCEEYTIVLSLADVSDNMFDSAVFLEARSFGTGTLKVDINTVSLDGSLAEGCEDGLLSFDLPRPVEQDFFLDYTIFGTATNGVDYSTIPTDLFIAAGDSSVSVPITVFEDGIQEGIETLGIDVQLNICKRDTFYFLLNDNQLTFLDLGPDTVICSLSPVRLDGNIPLTLPEPPQFSNTTDYPIIQIADNFPPPSGTQPTISPIDVLGVQPTTLEAGVLKNICINIDHNFASDVDLFLFTPSGQFLELSTDNGKDGNDYIDACFTETAVDTIDFGSQAPDSIPPFTGDWYPEGFFEDIYGSPINGEWYLALKDDQNGFDGTLLDWTICFNPVYQVNFQWTPETGLSCTDCPDPIATPDTTTTYTLEITDTYGCSIIDQITIEVSSDVAAPQVNCIPTTNSITLEWAAVDRAEGYEININGSGWTPVNGNLSHTITNLGMNEIINYEIRGTGNCEGSIFSDACTTLNCVSPVVMVDQIIPADCNGAATGSVQASASGASPFHIFELAGVDVNNTGLFTGLPAGEYNLVVTNNIGCPASELITITEPDPLQAVIIVEDSISCTGESDGALTVVVTGGNGPFNFTWNNTSTDSINRGISTGMIEVAISDQGGCMTMASFDLGEPEPFTLFSSFTQASCFGGNNATAMALPDGGTPPYTYVWANGQTTQTATGLTAGAEPVQVTDRNGCVQNTIVDIQETPSISLSFEGVMPGCAGGANGNITAMPTGGTGSYSYLWDNGQTWQTVVAIGAGTYSVTVTDERMCTTEGSFSIDDPAPIMVDPAISLPSCSNSADATISVAVTGGTGNYTFSWADDNTAITTSRDNLTAGNYTFTVRDEIGCEKDTIITINAPDPITIITSNTPVGCSGGNTGAAAVEAMGGTGTLTYQWDINGTIVTTQMVENLAAGDYPLTVTDINNCTLTEIVTVQQSAGIDVVERITNINCFSENGGAVSLEISGGNAPYTLEWTDAAGNILGTSNSIENLTAGDYEIRITDANNCLQTDIFTVTQPEELTLNFTQVNDLNCFEINTGNIELSVEGGTGNKTYQWSNGANSMNISQLMAGTYTVTVTDEMSCTKELSTTIIQPAPLTISDTTLPLSCASLDDGSIAIAVSGGTATNGNYQYQWSNGGNTSLQENLPAGDYQVTITDNLGCTLVQSYNIDTPSPIILDVVPEPVACNGTATGMATVNASGGAGNYTYQWDAEANNQTTATANALLANIYMVTVTDGNNCTQTTIAEVLEPLEISNTFEQTDVDCFGASSGTLTAQTGGGIEPFTYSWTGPDNFSATTSTLDNLPAGIYNLTITDGNNCTSESSATLTQPATGLTAAISAPDTVCFAASTGTATVLPSGGTGNIEFLWDFENQTTSTINNLPAGSWNVTVTDESGCSTLQTATIEENPEIIVELSETGPLCFDGTDGQAAIAAITSGGNPASPDNYTYRWNTGETTATIENLTGGDRYTIIVNDIHQCVGEASIQISNPDAIEFTTITIENTNCAGDNTGSLEITAVGGTAPYTYLWGGNANNQTTAALENLAAGSYEVTITDANQCSSSNTYTIETPDELTIAFNVGEISCPGEADGILSTSISGGTAPYQYQWSTGSTEESISGIEANTYALTVTDAQGCFLEASQAVDAPALLTATMDITEPTCFGDRDGRIVINAVGGIAPYQYTLDDDSFDGSSIRIGITAGTYTVRIQDSKGCSFDQEITINNPPQLQLEADTERQMILGDSTQLTARPINGTGEITLEWDAPYDGTLSCYPDSFPACETPFSIAQHTITYTAFATDELGCMAETELKVIVEKPRQVMVPTAFTPNNDGANDLLLVHGVPDTEILQFRVFDRWGSLLFQSGGYKVNEENVGWDGSYRNERMASGVYIWMVEVKYLDGEIGTFSGNTTLLR